ncbi:MAG: 50S ribosomal protein L18 [Candidatus Omnitrophica bacterium]|nr:50S ribosomal protein L18 [Candidatus Omnitrophota bacterium]
MSTNVREIGRMKRHQRICKKIHGTADRPRLCVHRSLKNIYVQAIDDAKGHTICAFSTMDKKFIEGASWKGKVDQAEKLGQYGGALLLQKGIKQIAFDRGGYKYHGRIKTLSESLRKAGIQF